MSELKDRLEGFLEALFMRILDNPLHATFGALGAFAMRSMRAWKLLGWVWPLQTHIAVSRTNTLMEIRTQDNTLQRFGLRLRLRTQTQTISSKW